MRKFICKLLLLALIVWGADYVVGKSFSNLYTHSIGGTTQRDNYINYECKEDILIMGSSRASHHYVSKLISDSIGMPVYNAGRDGNGIILNYGFLSNVLKRYAPKIIVYDLTADFDWKPGDNDRFLPHLRHYYSSDEIKMLFDDVNKTEKYKMLSNTYRINSLVPHILFDNFFATPDNDAGYIPLYDVLTESESRDICLHHPLPDFATDDVKLKYLAEFVRLCKTNGVKLYFVVSPALDWRDGMYDYAKTLSRQYDIPLIYFPHDHSEFDNINYFQDSAHLNNEGAIAYSKVIASLISHAD